jgi:hypothetical protein
MVLKYEKELETLGELNYSWGDHLVFERARCFYKDD